MAQAKIELVLGAISFTCEGEESWLAEQFDKVLDAATTISAVRAADPADDEGGEIEGESTPGEASNTAFTTSLVSHIRDKKGEANQVQRFLVAADWLRQRGVSPLTASGVAKILSDNHQKRLANPADCLNKNVSKGYCEKTKTGFFLTPDGLKHLGHS